MKNTTSLVKAVGFFILISSLWVVQSSAIRLDICISRTKANCISLPELILSNGTRNLTPNTTLNFHPGNYTVFSVISFENAQNLSLSGLGLPRPRLVCTRAEFGFSFRNIQGLQINNLEFSGCGMRTSAMDRYTGYKWYTSIFISSSWDVSLTYVTVKNGYGYGVSCLNILGKSSITNSSFSNMNAGGGLCATYTDDRSSSPHATNYIDFLQSSFTDNSCLANYKCDGTGVLLLLYQSTFTVNIYFRDAKIANNRAKKTAGISVQSTSMSDNNIFIEKSWFKNNTVYNAGSSGFSYTHGALIKGFGFNSNKVVVKILTSIFTDNIGHLSQYPYERIVSDAIYFLLIFEELTHNFVVQDCTIKNNVGGRSVGLGASTMNEAGQQPKGIALEVIRTSFFNNTSTAYLVHQRGVVELLDMPNNTFEDCEFRYNAGSGLLLQSSNVYFGNLNLFKRNTASYGAGLALYKGAFLYLKPNSRTQFERNHATNSGGGMYIATTEALASTQCALQFADYNNPKVYLTFIKNTAKLSGNDVYGGNLNLCQMGTRNAAKAMLKIAKTVEGTPDFSSQSQRICHCYNGAPDCVKYIKNITTYPGAKFTLPLLAIGQLIYENFTLGVPGAIYTSLENAGPGKLPHEMQVQEGTRQCSELTYSIFSPRAKEIMVITADEEDTQSLESLRTYLEFNDYRYTHDQLIQETLRIPIYVNVSLLPCPIGFELSDRSICECAASLAKLRVNCSIDTLTFQKQPQSWVGTGSPLVIPSDNTSKTKQLLTHHHCPYDYCDSNSSFLLSMPDSQCSNNRTGVLCGECKKGLSLVLGSSKCRKCSNSYLALIPLFALAGILLIAFLILTDMTVASGVVNGLLFYFNIININTSSLFPPGTDHGVFYTVMAWMNLDLGIETCFYDGLDAYASAWLQFVFPFYLWLLVGIIIVMSRYSKSVNRICGRNIVQVLATLFLLSYTKLQRAVITGLSFTFVESEKSRFAVWLPDGNISFLQGKHIYFFIFTCLCLVCIILPYTLAILLGQWLHSKSEHRMFVWVYKLKPLYDAYLGPFKSNLRWWPGLLLLARVLLLLVAAVNVLGDTSVNLIAMSLISSFLIALVWQKGGVYSKLWILSCLETFFLLNLAVLSSVALYNKNSGGNQSLAVSISIGSSMFVFVILLGYHAITRIRSIMKKNPNNYRGEMPVIMQENSDNKMIDIVDFGRDVSTSTISVIDGPSKSLLQPHEVELDSF